MLELNLQLHGGNGSGGGKRTGGSSGVRVRRGPAARAAAQAASEARNEPNREVERRLGESRSARRARNTQRLSAEEVRQATGNTAIGRNSQRVGKRELNRAVTRNAQGVRYGTGNLSREESVASSQRLTERQLARRVKRRKNK